MHKQISYIVVLLFPFFLSAQSDIRLSNEYDLEEFIKKLIPQNDSLSTSQDSMQLKYGFKLQYNCKIDKERDSLIQLIQLIKKLEKGNTIDSTASYHCLFLIETHTDNLQNQFDGLNTHGVYCITKGDSIITGSQLLIEFTAKKSEDSPFPFSNFMYSFSNEYLVIRKSNIYYGGVANFETSYTWFYKKALSN